MKLRLECTLNDYLNDAQDIPRAFAPIIEIDENADDYLRWDHTYSSGVFTVYISSNVFGEERRTLSISDSDISLFKKFTKRFLKNCLYEFLSKKLDIYLPYGSLTGVRPTKLYYELMEHNDPIGVLKDEFKVSERRAELIKRCVRNQEGIINRLDDAVALFINIPFCPTRCSYCSFISTEVWRVKKEIPHYVECVKAEIDIIKRRLAITGQRVTSIYVGGGTPGSIGADNLNNILFPVSDFGVEFTVEAGRPDTINQELVDVLKNNNVTRVSVNPQSFKQRTLDIIGRKHTVDDIFRAYDLVKDVFFVNMDLIAGLPGESLDDFRNSLLTTISLAPDNITVHSLSLKRGSVMNNDGQKKRGDGSVVSMTDYAMDVLEENGYEPYYMYRQKNTADNLENVGYTQKGFACKYNVDMMEESISVIGVGAGAMSKRISGGRIERISNPKGFREYVDRINDILLIKSDF